MAVAVCCGYVLCTDGHYIAERRPFKISKGVYDNWPAMQKWTKSGLLTHYAGVTVNVFLTWI